MAQVIQIKRRIPGTGKPASGTGAGQITAGELATSISATGAAGVADLFIGDGTYVHDLVSATRQVELAGTQTITGAKVIGAAGSLTSPLANFHILGGTNGYLLSTDGSGALSWIKPPSAVIVSATAPPSAGLTAGDMWFDSANEILHVWDGSNWVEAVPDTDLTGHLALTGGNMSGVINFAAGQTIAGYLPLTLTAPTTVAMAAHNLTISATTGHLIIPTTLSTDGDNVAATKKYVDDAAAAGFTGVNVEAPITGNGMPGAANALGVTMATAAQINTGTDDVYPIDSEGLRTQTGAAVSTLATTAKTIVPAINELDGEITTLSQQIAAVSGALRFVGNYNAATSQVTSAATGTLTVNANLPAPSAPPAANANEGWYVIVTNDGTPAAPAPNVQMHTGDWIVSTGTQWIHVPLYHVAVTATNVGISTINAQTWTNVQQALSGIYTMLTTAGSAAVVADDVSIVGDGTTADPLEVALVDGGTY